MRKLMIILLLINLAITFSCKNSRVIKKEVTITYKYSDTRRNKVSSIDTSTVLYDIKGRAIVNNAIQKVYYSYQIKDTIIYSSKQKIIKQILWSDSSIETITRLNYNDSAILYDVEKEDTLTKETIYRKRKKTVRKRIENYSYSFENHKDIKITQNNIFKRKWEETTWSEGIIVKVHKFSYNKIAKIYKEYSFNDSINEWFVSEKRRYYLNGLEARHVEQFYHNYFKMYFKIYTKYKYNCSRHVTLIVKKNHYRFKESKVIILYEYY